MQETENKPKQRRKKAKVVQFQPIPDKLYFSIGEAGRLCEVKPYVIRFWEQVFSMLKPAKLRCGRRYYQREEILLIRTIRTLLYEKGFTIEGACLQLSKDRGGHLLQGQNISEPLVADTNPKNQLCEIANNADMDTILSLAECEKNESKKKALLEEVAGHIDEIISLLEAKPEAEMA